VHKTETSSVFAPRHDMTPAQQCMAHPRAFAWRVLCGFRANQGLLLAGAIAYYALLSIVPLLILSVIALSHVIPEHELLATIGRYLAWLVPSQSNAVVNELRGFLDHRDVVGWVLLLTMLFFSSLAFAVLENALSVIFVHRIVERKRPLVMKLLLPYIYVACLAAGLLLVTLVAGGLENLGEYQLDLFGRQIPLGRFSHLLLYLLGLAGEIVLLTSIYVVMPAGRLDLRHALMGAVSAVLLWELTRHVLVWYFATLSQVGVVYGSMTTTIVVLLSLELGATLVLLGAQVISEYERLVAHAPKPPPADLVIHAN
jgi:YihY family inner membrane protein